MSMMKYRLVTPGPAMVPAETLLELAKPVRHHRTPENKAMIAEALQALKQVFQTESPVAIFASSGTGAMETAVANVVRPGKKAIVCTAGKWGERWLQLCDTYGAEIIKLEEPYGKAIAPERVAGALAEHPDAVAVYGTLSETSTGVGNDIEAYGKIVGPTPTLLCVDGISGVGAMECRTDAWQIDMLVVGSQKALMLPPGLAFISASQKARDYVASLGKPTTYYFDLLKYLKSAEDGDTPYTPAHTLIAAQLQSLRTLLETGMENVWALAKAMSRATLAAAKALELQPLAERPSAGLTALWAPSSIDCSAWEKLLERKYGVKVAGGQGDLKGKIIRIAHMGYVDPLDVVGIVAALEWSLRDLGYAVDPGKAVAVATQELAEFFREQK